MRTSQIVVLAAVALWLDGCGPSGSSSDDAHLSNLTASAGTLSPAFDPDVTTYTVGAALLPASTTVTATKRDPSAGILINSQGTFSGVPSAALPLLPGVTTVKVEVLAGDKFTWLTYTILFDRSLGGQEAYVKASNTGREDALGRSVAIAGDTLVVGAPGEASNAVGVNGSQADDSAPSSGAVYVYVRDLTTLTWSQQAYLKASNAQAGDAFGTSVAISGDTLVVGARGEASSATGVNGNQADNGAPGSGAAYVFVRSGTTWSQQAYLKASNADAGDGFGFSVALSGDGLAVGAPDEDSSATAVNGVQTDNGAVSRGAAYAFLRSGTTWSQVAYLKSSNPSPSTNNQFGYCVSIAGDRLAVGAPGQDVDPTGTGSTPQSGAAYVFAQAGAFWLQEAYLKASTSGAGDRFGSSVALLDDMVAVGATGEDSNATGVNGDPSDNSASNSGAAYVFVRSGSSWSQAAYLKASNPGPDDAFGQSVALSGDTLIVGAPGEDGNGTGTSGIQADNSAGDSGAAYVFVRTGTTWSQQVYLKASNTGAGDRFGTSVAVWGVTLGVSAAGEASNAVGVGGNQADDSVGGSGAVYVFR